MKQIITQKIERVSKELLENYWKEVTELIGRSHGVYALYSDNELYYVGKAVDLKKRVRDHLKDKHVAQWNYFSIFLVSKLEHVDAIEALLIRIANPKGNIAKPKGGINSQLNELKKMIKLRQSEQLDRMFGDKSKKNKKAKTVKKKGNNPMLKDRFERPRPLAKEYKGKEYKATLLTSGKIKYDKVIYDSPTASAKAIVDRSTVNGWTFWYIQNDDNNWVKLRHLDD
ncbi:MAG: GIY-YIG nuclease family protein [Fluviicola sp.]|nr:GIY-YIG nuclease family protein [Fluviicola sp.]